MAELQSKLHVTRAGHSVEEPVQPDWPQLAREQYAGFNVRGSGPFAVIDGFKNLITLYSYRMEAESHGHVIEIQQPKPRPRFRQITVRDRNE
jgi:hypothetical protein